MVAIPDFAAGAMENWGLITYRLSALLYDPAASSEHAQNYVAYVVAHELAHQVRHALTSSICTPRPAPFARPDQLQAHALTSSRHTP